jgi:hypothetical protein
MWLATRDSSYITSTIIDAQQQNTVVAFQNGETEKAELCGFTITHGKSQADIGKSGNIGGGIFCKNASPYLHHLIVENNLSNLEGGGMYLEKSNSVIEYCVIRNNRAVMQSGGGIYITSGNIQINNSIISNNTQGGGLACTGYSKVRCYSSLLAHNSLYALFTGLSKLDIVNCTITNHVNDAFNISYSDVNIINSIFWNVDYPETSEIVIFNDTPEFPISHVTVAFSDINGGKNRIAIRSSHNDQLFWKEGNIDKDPYFKYDFSLDSLSPCIDAGTPYYQIGDSVIININRNNYYGKAPDIGAFESNYTPTGIKSIKVSGANLTTFPNPFNTTISIAFDLSKASKVNLSIYTSTGQKINEIVSNYLPLGKHSFQWNGEDKSGKKAASGSYIVMLRNGINIQARRILYLK